MDGNSLSNLTRLAFIIPPVSVAAAPQDDPVLGLGFRTLRLDVNQQLWLQHLVHLDVLLPRSSATRMGFGCLLAGFGLFFAEQPGGNG